MPSDMLFEYEETLRSGGAPVPEVLTKALKGVLAQHAKEMSEVQAALADIKQTLLALDRKFDAVDRKLDATENRLLAEIKEVRSEIRIARLEASNETKTMGLELTKLLNGFVWRAVLVPTGTVGAILALFAYIKGF